jgi:prepilin-type processing-associated H-X9-DG protein
LVALLLPAVQVARESARRMSCSSNLRQMSLAIQNYHETFKQFPFGHVFRGSFDGAPADGDGGNAFGWGYSILPYLEQQALFDQFNPSLMVCDTTKPGGKASNMELQQTPLAVFSCPSDNKPSNMTDGACTNAATSSYQGAGTSYDGWEGVAVGAAPNTLRYNGAFDRDNRGSVGLRDLTDGTSNSLVIVESKWKMTAAGTNRNRIYGATDTAVGASGASNALMDNGQWPMNWTAAQGNPQPARTAGSQHPRGAQFAFGDGSVKFLSENIQHTATAWVNNANAFDLPNSGAKYGVYQRLYSVADGLLVSGF